MLPRPSSRKPRGSPSGSQRAPAFVTIPDNAIGVSGMTASSELAMRSCPRSGPPPRTRSASRQWWPFRTQCCRLCEPGSARPPIRRAARSRQLVSGSLRHHRPVPCAENVQRSACPSPVSAWYYQSFRAPVRTDGFQIIGQFCRYGCILTRMADTRFGGTRWTRD